MRRIGGYATLRRLNEIIDFSSWKTKTPEASVRRIVQLSRHFFRIQPGLWGLEDSREEILRKLEYVPGDKRCEEQFSHGYYQGLLLEIGKYRNKVTYVPAQDQNRRFINQRLGDMANMLELPLFTHDNLLRRARTIDVIWFNERQMPCDFYEVEHTTDIKNSLSKFYELQDFYAGFYIVADSSRKKEFENKLAVSMFASIQKRVRFIDYNRVAEMYEGLSRVSNVKW